MGKNGTDFFVNFHVIFLAFEFACGTVTIYFCNSLKGSKTLRQYGVSAGE
jgi:hypothetical protein